MDSAGKHSSCIEVCPTHCIFSVLGSFEILASPVLCQIRTSDGAVIYQCEKQFSFSSDWSTSAGSQGNRHTEWAGSVRVLPGVTTGFSGNGEAVSPARQSNTYLVLLEGMSWRWLASVISWFSVKEMTLTNQEWAWSSPLKALKSGAEASPRKKFYPRRATCALRPSPLFLAAGPTDLALGWPAPHGHTSQFLAVHLLLLVSYWFSSAD